MSIVASSASPTITAIGALVAIIFIIVSLVFAQKRKEAWSKRLAELGIDQRGKGWTRSGVVDGVGIEAKTFTRSQGKSQVRYTSFAFAAPAPAPLELAREGMLTRLFGGDLQLGDATFDKDVRVSGAPGVVLAVLDPETRDLVHGALRQSWSLKNGVWSFTGRGFMLDTMDQVIALGVRLAHATSHPGAALPSRLAERVAGDPLERVRRVALERLLADHPDDPATATALDAALADAAPAVAIIAAEVRGHVPTLTTLVDGDDLRVAAHAARLLIDGHGHDAVALATRLEPRFIPLLADPEEATRVAAARALGEVGTLGAVASLVPHREKFMGGALKDAAREAILAIQRRAGDVAAGRLSMAEVDHQGGMSLHEDPAAAATEVALRELPEVEEA